MGPIKIAIIGAGVIGRRHAELVANSSKCSLVGICDVNSEGQQVAARFSVPFYDDVADLLKTERPDGAIDCTPNGQHLSVAESCASHRVHVLIEKPIADTIESARRITEVANESGIRVLTGHHRRHSPLVQKAREVVQGNRLGKLVAVSMMWTLLKPPEYFDLEWRTKRPGGGPALINLIHEIDILRFVCGEIRHVYAQANSAVRNLDVEDSLAISISFENGVVASIIASDAVPSPWSYEMSTHENQHYFHTNENCYHFFGTQGSLGFPSMEFWSYPDKKLAGWQYPMETSHFSVQRTDPLVVQLNHFCDVIDGRVSPIVSSTDATQSLSGVLAVLKSIETNSPVTVETFS
jgi:predicted dehydrogenase